jgi:acyl-CoA reductase-like NAD-dependent aldehyde dehydrogenase
MTYSTKENLIECFNPATQEKLCEIPFTSESEILLITKKSKEAFFIWSSLGIEKRTEYLKNIYNIIISEKNNIAQIITKNNGKPLAESYLTEIASTLQVMEYFIKNGSKLLSNKELALGPLYPTKKSFIEYDPIGVIGIIEPWNYPFYLPFSAITKALITGNTFIFKPSSTVSAVGKLIEEILNKSEIPKGVANVIYGNSKTADTLINSEEIDKIVFTGSVGVGKKIAEACSKRLIPVCLELGGKDPAIVINDSNIDYAAGGILWGAISNCGQACASTERVYVQSEIYNEFADKISYLTKQLKVGNGLDDDTDVGPLINEEQLIKIQDHVNDSVKKGAKVLCGGKRIDREGYFFEPTVLTNVTHSMKVMQEETFGPVIPIMKFEEIEEAIHLANDSKYGLAASIWTSNNDTAKKIASSLNCGTVWINDSLFLQAHPACPWTGYKESGYGNSTVYDFTKPKHINFDNGFIPGIRPKSYWWYPYKGKAGSYSDLIEVLYKPTLKEKAMASFKTVLDFLK